MNPPASLSGAHLRTYETIFQHPLSHNLGWHDVLALFRHLGHVEEQTNGNFKVTRRGQSLMLPPSRQKDLSSGDDLMRIRHFLQHTGASAPAARAVPETWLLVINHREARIFPSIAAGTAPVLIQPRLVTSQAHGYVGLVRGQEKPADPTFFTPIAEVLRQASRILVFASGTGGGNESDRFVGWVKIHHADLAGRIAGILVIDEHHLTDAQLLAKARDYQVTAGTAACA